MTVTVAVLIVNLVLSVIIFILGILAYAKKKGEVPLYIGIAFGLFGISHILTLLGLAAALNVLLVIIRLIAYLLVVFVLYRALSRKSLE